MTDAQFLYWFIIPLSIVGMIKDVVDLAIAVADEKAGWAVVLAAALVGQFFIIVRLFDIAGRL